MQLLKAEESSWGGESCSKASCLCRGYEAQRAVLAFLTMHVKRELFQLNKTKIILSNCHLGAVNESFFSPNEFYVPTW